ncbi:NAD-dependent epimerase/dehydratase [Candidatus Methylacidithermus pantelleriae]|uniref:NAD-dependent epimerase/dehydratase n=1 Tax=Candidatus Methylacidithermus pantelleriae TaxID=2744239 RepID=A0A8J2BMK2_9BACT|nr:NAD-dependent epimerase/dehydratase [Candidatus Methylacidithermus pantelleriae]
MDHEPAPISQWLSVLTKAVRAKPPRHIISAWLGRLFTGEHGVLMMAEIRGASNAKAKRELGWRPLWAS